MQDILDKILVIGLLYAVYRGLVRGAIIRFNYRRKKGIKLELDKLYSGTELSDMLKSKGFSYPDLRNIRINEVGNAVIEGKHFGHELTMNENVLKIDIGRKFFKSEAKAIEEAEIIKSYIEKAIDVSAPIDPYKKYKKFKSNKYKNAVAVLLFIAFVFSTLGGDENFKSDLSDSTSEAFNSSNSSNISDSYLTEYSDKITIGEAFNNFFDNPKWETYKIGIQKYVDFQGGCYFDNKEAVAVITFAVFDDSFKVDSIKINNEELDPIFHTALFEKIFSDEDNNISTEEDLQ